MTEPIINILRLIFIGTATTIVRIIGQLAIPTGEQTVLSPSIFAQNGTMPVCFYDLRDFCLLPDRRAVPAHTEKNGREPHLAGAAIRLCLLRSVGSAPFRSACLPHVAPLDRITYPVADGLALIVMGLLLGWLFGQTRLPVKRSRKLPALPGLAITLCLYRRAAALSALSVFTRPSQKKPSRPCYGACWQVL